MRKWGRVYLLFLLISFSVFGLYGLSSAVEVMPLSQIEPGMQGTGYTVIQGTRIQQFDVEVLGILSGMDSLEDYILVCVGGPLITRTQGIADGMSGSPVYINGKLVGALAYKYDRSSSHIGLLTPIESMLNILDYDIPNVLPLVDLHSRSYLGYDDGHFGVNKEDFIPVGTPVVVSGLSNDGRAKSALESSLEDFNIGPVRVTGAGISDTDVTIEPGSSIGLQLMRGHISAAVLGTVTYLDNNRFLAFGHPFLHMGSSKYMASSAHIYTTIGSDSGSYKLGAPSGLIGTITQDRQAGISGVMNTYPRVLTVRINVKCDDLQKESEMFVQLVQEPQLIPGLLVSALLEAIDSTIDRIGQGTSEVTFEILARNLDNKLVRNNIYYSSFDVAMVSIPEILEGVNLLLHNDIKEVEIIDIGVYVDIQDVRKTAKITNVVLDKTTVSPGQTIMAEVSIKPFREELFVQEVEIEIPETFHPGYNVLTVYGGENYFISQSDLYGVSSSEQSMELELSVESFSNRSKNNQLILELMPYGLMFNTYLGDMDVHEESEIIPQIDHGEVYSKLSEDKQEDMTEREEMEFPLEDYGLSPSTFISEDEMQYVIITLDTEYIIEGWKSIEIEVVTTQEYAPNDEDLDEATQIPLGTLGQID